MSDAPPRQDPRFRPFRGAMWGLYLLVATFVGLAVTVSVIRSVREMTPERRTAVGAPLEIAACRALAQQLFAELDAHRRDLAGAREVRRVDADWTRFRVGWMNQYRDAEARCDVEGADRKQVRVIFDKLQQVADLYTTHAVQFAGEVGPTVDAFRAALDEGAPGAAQRVGSTTP